MTPIPLLLVSSFLCTMSQYLLLRTHLCFGLRGIASCLTEPQVRSYKPSRETREKELPRSISRITLTKRFLRSNARVWKGKATAVLEKWNEGVKNASGFSPSLVLLPEPKQFSVPCGVPRISASPFHNLSFPWSASCPLVWLISQCYWQEAQSLLFQPDATSQLTHQARFLWFLQPLCPVSI